MDPVDVYADWLNECEKAEVGEHDTALETLHSGADRERRAAPVSHDEVDADHFFDDDDE